MKSRGACRWRYIHFIIVIVAACELITTCTVLANVVVGSHLKLTTFILPTTPRSRTAAFSFHGQHWQLGKRLALPTQLAATTTTTTQGKALQLDVSDFIECEREVLPWLHTLSTVTRSEPCWIGTLDHRAGAVLTTSPSNVVEQHLQALIVKSLLSNTSPLVLFPSNKARSKFDVQWKEILLNLLPRSDLHSLLLHGQSNSHPMRLQLVAIPPNTRLPVHAHPAVELDIPLFGQLHEQLVPNFLISRQSLCRQRPEHCVAEFSNFFDTHNGFSFPPTAKDLEFIRNDLTKRIQQQYYVQRMEQSTDNEFQLVVDSVVPSSSGNSDIGTVHNLYYPGDCLVNPVGSVHQSYTKDIPCLLLVLGPNVHAHLSEKV